MKHTTLHEWFAFHTKGMSWDKISKMMAILQSTMVAIMKRYRDLIEVKHMPRFGKPL
jgi:hypothetical protein